MTKVYLDHSAAAPLLPEVREAMMPYLDKELICHRYQSARG
jgi:cysteine sulfinate desulfinase/cysteine desulfurase-like protein